MHAGVSVCVCGGGWGGRGEVCVKVAGKSKAFSVWRRDQCNRSGVEMEETVRAELDVKSFRQNVLSSEFIMCCFQPIDVCCSHWGGK